MELLARKTYETDIGTLQNTFCANMWKENHEIHKQNFAFKDQDIFMENGECFCQSNLISLI